MARITYIAKRDFEPSTVAQIFSAGISVSGTDDSFNAASGLSGLINNEWILVSGFNNAANNGWFQLSANSTSTKISQDTTTSLVTESSGVAVTIKGYKRGFGQSYDIDNFLVERADRNVKVVKNVQRALSGGQPEVLTHRRDVTFDITTGLILEADIKKWREFLASVEGGESFTLDRYGTVASPSEPLLVYLEDDSYSEVRDSNLMRYRISFTVGLI